MSVYASGESSVRLQVSSNSSWDSALGYPDAKFDDVFETSATASWISQGAYSVVALQFPDDMLKCARRCATLLRKACPPATTICVIADNTVGDFSVDVCSARHVQTHFNPSAAAAAIAAFAPQLCHVDHVVIVASQAIPLDDQHALLHALRSSGDPARQATFLLARASAWLQTSSSLAEARLPGAEPHDAAAATARLNAGEHALSFGCHEVVLPRPALQCKCAAVYVGSDSDAQLELRNWNPVLFLTLCAKVAMLETMAWEWYILDAANEDAPPQRPSLDVARSLKRRYFLVQKAKDAERIGLVVAAGAAAGCMELVWGLQRLIHECCYVFHVGRVNEAKLGNFPEVGAFCVIAAAEHSLFRSLAMPAPVISPYELVMALKPNTMWDPVAYSLHWQSIPLADLSVDASEVEAAADVSLVSGKLRSFAFGASSVTDVALAPTGALARLQDKEWKGLGSSGAGAADASGAFAALVEGLSGCAWSYESESK